MDKWIKMLFDKLLRDTEGGGVDLSMKRQTHGMRMVNDKTILTLITSIQHPSKARKQYSRSFSAAGTAFQTVWSDTAINSLLPTFTKGFNSWKNLEI